MKAPENWKELKRHPLSAEYANIKGKQSKNYVENLKRHGVVGKRKITLHEGMVLDGWQLQRACIDADIEPEYENLRLTGAMTAEEYVETVNDRRRHETPEEAKKRAEKRRQRVAKARTEGRSIRAIAEDEGVSREQVRRDLQAATDMGVSVESPEGKVTGRDGKVRAATPARPAPTPEREPGDDTEAEAAAAGPLPNPPDREPGDDTESEAAAREAEKALPRNGSVRFNWHSFERPLGQVVRGPDEVAEVYPGERRSEEYDRCHEAMANFVRTWKGWQGRLGEGKVKPLLDAEGHPVPDGLRDAFVNAERFKEAHALVGKLEILVAGLARQPGGDQLRMHLTAVQKGTEAAPRTVYRSQGLEDLGRDLESTMPHSVCPYCKGDRAPGCKGCAGVGWVSEMTWKGTPEEIKAKSA
jgi:hypothetical protein